MVEFSRGQGHTGLVVAVDGEALLTVEGNAGNAVSGRRYEGWRARVDIVGFGRPRGAANVDPPIG